MFDGIKLQVEEREEESGDEYRHSLKKPHAISNVTKQDIREIDN